MKVIGVIPARYASTRIHEKPLADICGHPMVWWVYQRALEAQGIDDLYVATDNERVMAVCEKYGMKSLITSDSHLTPTSRVYEVSRIINGDLYVFISGDEPLIEPNAISKVISEALSSGCDVTNAMTKIATAPEVIDYTNIKVVTNADGFLLYTTRSPLPYPKGGLDFDYMKFVGIGAFTRNALQFYNDTPRGILETIEECDLMRFIEKGIKVKMTDVNCRSLSVDAPKDLDVVTEAIRKAGGVIPGI